MLKDNSCIILFIVGTVTTDNSDT